MEISDTTKENSNRERLEVLKYLVDSLEKSLKINEN